MVRFSAAALVALLGVACSTSPMSGRRSPAEVVFVGVDLTSLSNDQAQIVREASEDFVAVQAGKPPIHAKLNLTTSIPSDGGTSFYLGKGYSLTIVSSFSSFGRFTGVAYGPIIKFDSSFARGNEDTISDVRVYSFDALKRLGE